MSAGHELYATDETFREVADLLFGGGADLVAKANPTQSDVAAADHRKRKITAGLSAVGAAAGAAGLTLGGHNVKRAYAGARYGMKGTKAARVAAGKIKPVMPKKQALRHALGEEKLATGLVPLEVAGLTGEVAATRILHGDTKKKVRKDLGEVSEMATTNPKKQMTRAAITNAPRAAGKGLEYSKVAHGQLKKLPDKVSTKKVKKSAEDVEVIWSGDFAKANLEKQQLFGWASVIEVNGEPVLDLQGDVISADEMEKAGYSYVMKSRKGGDMHLRDNWAPIQKSEMIESFIVTDEKRQAMGLPDSVPTGWWVGFQVQDPQVWADVKAGKRTGFSIHGTGKRTPG
jgi:hypothetical protein